MKKIIAFSLFGNKPMYNQGAIENAQMAHQHFPQWQTRYYVSDDANASVINDLKKAKAEIVVKKHSPSYGATFWRFDAAREKKLEALIVRDVDSRFSERETEAVNQWLASDKAFHIMRDHPFHTTPILGGMWGVKGNILKNIHWYLRAWIIKSFILKKSFENKGTDQYFLAECIYPRIKHNALIHSELVFYKDEKPIAFPSKRNGLNFIGQVVDENNNPDKEFEYALLNAKPVTFNNY